MGIINWNRVPNFSPDEWGSDANLIDPDLVYWAQQFRDHFNDPVHINKSIDLEPDQGRHTKRSYHYLAYDEFGYITRRCQAFDFWVESDLSYYDQFMYIITTPGVRGVGFYPWWNNPGFHVDIGNRQDIVWRPTINLWYCIEYKKYVNGTDKFVDFIIGYK